MYAASPAGHLASAPADPTAASARSVRPYRRPDRRRQSGARHRGETLAAEVVAGDPPGRSAHNGTWSTRVGRGSRERKPHVTCTKNTITVWNARIEGAAVFSVFSGASGYLTGDFRLGAPRARRFLKQNTRRPKQRYRIGRKLL